eukprot:CAMPEP_0177694878 /NCGR_PEP_ID=MMETSP0484_2-20121128/3164_1 /TAXON_ID=354590 /ORGANISM="Rhodomonas lens, Strain RHODO" /LENGTH=604 /DNA_ID=CAMNT_0019205777 /DNA_START=155 /DNA_END=1965 /DNA_ORIENTATION=+
MSAVGLENAAVNLTALRDRARIALTECIDKMRGPKALVLDPSLSGPLGLVAEKQLLKEHGVEKTYHLRHDPIETDQRRILFLVRDKIPNMKAIASQIRQHKRNRQQLDYLVIMVPRRTIVCERVLEEEGVYNDVQLGEYDLDLIPCEEDVVSMEIPDGYRECHLDGDKSSLFYAARGLMRLQSLFGVIPTIKGKGHAAKAVADMLIRMRRELGEQDDEPAEPEIDELILIDRETDMVTPMLTQLTYEGLIDDTYGINNGIVELPGHLIGSAGAATQAGQEKKAKIKVQFNNSDSLFTQLRDINFEQVGSIVKKRATFLKSVQDEKDQLQDKSVTEIKEYVRKLISFNIQQEKNLLSLHTSIALEIKAQVTGSAFSRRLDLEQALIQGRIGADKAAEAIQDLMYQREPFLKILRLLVLASYCNAGLRKLKELKHDMVQVYGYEAMLAVHNLEKLGLLKKGEGVSGIAAAMPAGLSVTAGISVAANLTNKIAATSGWEAVKKRLHVVVEGADDPAEDVAYVYSGYAPISIRLVERALSPPVGGWTSLEETLRPLPGPLFETVQEPTHAHTPPGFEAPPISRPPKTRHVAMIFFLGGVTCGEISAVR